MSSRGPGVSRAGLRARGWGAGRGGRGCRRDPGGEAHRLLKVRDADAHDHGAGPGAVHPRAPAVAARGRELGAPGLLAAPRPPLPPHRSPVGRAAREGAGGGRGRHGGQRRRGLRRGGGGGGGAAQLHRPRLRSAPAFPGGGGGGGRGPERRGKRGGQGGCAGGGGREGSEPAEGEGDFAGSRGEGWGWCEGRGPRSKAGA